MGKQKQLHKDYTYQIRRYLFMLLLWSSFRFGQQQQQQQQQQLSVLFWSEPHFDYLMLLLKWTSRVFVWHLPIHFCDCFRSRRWRRDVSCSALLCYRVGRQAGATLHVRTYVRTAALSILPYMKGNQSRKRSLREDDDEEERERERRFSIAAAAINEMSLKALTLRVALAAAR